MTDSTPQLALREWRAHFSQPARVVSLLGAVLILTLVGPFSTAEVIRPLPRLGYWAVMVVLAYAAGFWAHRCADRWAPHVIWARIAIAGLLTGVLVLALVYLLNGLALDYWASGFDLLLLSANVMAIAAILSAVFQFAHAEPRSEPVAEALAHEAHEPPAILDRLPFDKRGPLVALSVEDHYVRIYTRKGEEMVLMRLSDAIREVGDLSGARVHRSHWAAFDQVTSVRRDGDRAILTMSTGLELPVSRANLPTLKEAGLLPR